MITSTFSSDNELSDKEFMVHLYTKYENLLFYTAQKYISERGSVEDVVQESLVKLHEKIRTIKPMPEIVLASYIRSTVRNTAINILKSTGYEEDRQISTENIIDVMDEHALSLDTLMQISRYRELLSNQRSGGGKGSCLPRGSDRYRQIQSRANAHEYDPLYR